MDFEYLLFLQNLRAEAPNFINSLLLFISEFAAGSLPVVIIVVFYWCIDKRTGQRMGLCFAGATMVTQLIKNIACVYRPWKQDARLQIAPEAAATATGYSFPSGHATLAASFYGNIAAYLKKYSKWWILPCVLLTLLTAFARNWLGAHTPQDVLVGMMIALVVLLLSKYLLDWADGGKNRDWLLATIGIILSAAMLIYTSVKPYPMDVLPDGTLLVDPWDMVTDCYKAAGAMMGFCLGWVLERHFVGFDAKGAGKARMIRGVVGVALLLAVRKGMKAAGNLLLGIGSKFIGIVVEVSGDAVYHDALADIARDQTVEEPLFREVPVVGNRRLVGQHHRAVHVAFDGRLIRGEREEQFVKPFDMLAGFDGAVLPKVLRQGQHQAFAVVQHVNLLTLLFGVAVRPPYGDNRNKSAQPQKRHRIAA